MRLSGGAGPSTFGTGGEGSIIRSPCSSFESTSACDRHPAARAQAAGGPVATAAGDVASQPVREFLDRTPRPVLEKPFELSALAELVGRAAGGVGRGAHPVGCTAIPIA